MSSKRILLCFCATLWAVSVFGQGTVFTYQGSLQDGGQAATGSYDLRFAIFDAGANGNQIGGAITNSATTVSNGLFVANLDFGASAFGGSACWLEIGARTNGDPGAFTILSPRQFITTVPYAVRAASASSVASSNISGTISAAALPPNVALLNSNQTFAGANTFQNSAVISRAGIGGDATLSALTVYDDVLNPALKTSTDGIKLGDVNNSSFGNYLNIDFENGTGFTFSGANVAINGGSISLSGGNVIIPAANDYKYATPKTHYYSVPSISFIPEGATYEVGVIGGDIYLATGSAVTVGYLNAPVHLPDGATVTSVTFSVVDNDGSYNLQPGQLWRVDGSTSTSYGNSQTMATVPIPASSNSTLVQTCTTSTISNAVIDNQTYAYYLRWGTQQANSNLRLVKVVIAYTVTKVD